MQRDQKRYGKSKPHPLPKKTEEIKGEKKTLTAKLIINDATQFITTSYCQLHKNEIKTTWRMKHNLFSPTGVSLSHYIVHSEPYEQL